MSETANYFDRFVEPEFRRYLAAENSLSLVSEAMSADELANTRDVAIRAAMASAVPAYHLADVAWNERPNWVPKEISSLAELRRWVQAQHCRMLRGHRTDDLDLLGDVVDAFKHHELTKRLPRRITSSRATITATTGWDELSWNEGKWGGCEQVILELNDGGKRALLSVLQNVIDMWREAIGRPLPPVGE